jgi:hypothetical protein
VATVETGKSRTKSVVVEVSRPPLLVSPASVLETVDISGRNSFRHIIDLFARLVGEARSPLDGAALSLGGPIDYVAGSYDVVGPGLAEPGAWPQSLPALETAVASACGLAQVTVVNDAVAFAYGVAWNSASAHDSLCLTLGTGIGATTLAGRAYPHTPTAIVPIELHSFRRHWPCCFSGTPHELAGSAFFRHARTTDWGLAEIARQFTLRVNWLIEALHDAVSFGGVVLGGGRSSWIDTEQLLPDVTIADRTFTSGNVGASAAWYWQHRHGLPPRAIVSPPSTLT